MVRSVITTIIYLSTAFTLVAQTSVSSQSYLESKIARLTTNQQTITQKTFKSPFLDEINIRTETDEFQLNKQNYELRFTPVAPRVRRAEERLYHLYEQEANAEIASEYEPLIEAAYESVLEDYETYRELQIAEQRVALHQERSNVMQQLLLAGQGSPRDYVRMEREQQELLIKVAEKVAELSAAATVDWSDWLSVEAVVLKLAGFAPNAAETGTSDSIDLALIDQEIALEMAESKRWFDFVGFEYNDDPEDPLREKLTVATSINLPIYGRNKLKLEELRIEKERELAVQSLEAAQKRGELDDLRMEVETKFRRWQQLNFRAAKLEQQLDDFIRRAQQSEAASPLLRLEERAARLDAADERLELELEIYAAYLEYLEESGLLFIETGQSYFH